MRHFTYITVMLGLMLSVSAVHAKPPTNLGLDNAEALLEVASPVNVSPSTPVPHGPVGPYPTHTCSAAQKNICDGDVRSRCKAAGGSAGCEANIFGGFTCFVSCNQPVPVY